MTNPSDPPQRSDLLVRDAELLVTMTGTELAGGWVSISDGLVDAVGATGSEPPADRVVSARGCLVTPGLVNVHHHMFQNLTRAFAPVSEHGFANWAKDLSRMWARLDEEASFVSTWIGLAELALGGCTLTTDDLYVHPCPGLIDAQIKAALDVGLRLDPCRGTIALTQDQGAPFADEIVQDEDTILADTERLITTYHDPSPNAMVRIVCGPTAADTAAPGLFRASAELAEKYDVQMTTHLSQHAGEHEWSLQRFGLDPVEWLDDVGWSTPRAWVAHCIFVDTAQIGRLAEWGVGVAHCPTSNSLGAQAIAPIPEMLEQGVRVGLAVDGCGSEHASMWLEARTAVLLARIRRGPTAMGARGALALATTGSAACLGREGQNGVLTPGACGDVVAWPLDGIYCSGAWTDPVEAWLRCGPTAARHTIVAGKVIVEDGRLVLPGLEEMLTRHAEISRDWQAVVA